MEKAAQPFILSTKNGETRHYKLVFSAGEKTYKNIQERKNKEIGKNEELIQVSADMRQNWIEANCTIKRKNKNITIKGLDKEKDQIFARYYQNGKQMVKLDDLVFDQSQF